MSRTAQQFLIAWLLLSLPWLATWWWLADLGGYPFNDDPFYAKPIAWWASEGRIQAALQYGELTASSLAHIWSGACAVWGHEFSYRWLFLACIVQQSLGVTALFSLARSLGHSGLRSMIFVGPLITFPLFYGHAFTFMTDGPAAAWSAIAVALLVRGTLRASLAWLCAGSLAIGWGYWIRQTNVALLAVPLLAMLLLSGMQRRGQHSNTRAELFRSGRLTVACLGAAGLMIGLFESSWLLPSSMSRMAAIQPEIDKSYLHRTAIAIYGWVLLAGWFSVPLCPMFIHSACRERAAMSRGARRFCDGTALLCLLLGLTPLVMTAGRACITSATGNFIQNAHYGPIFLSDMDEPGRWGELPGATWPIEVWLLLSVAAIVAAASSAWWVACNIVRVIATFSSRKVDLVTACSLSLIATTLTVGVALAVFIEPNMDRYWLFLFPAIAVWWQLISLADGFAWSRWSTAWAVGCMAIGLSMSIVFTHDLLAWNAARWRFITSYLNSGRAAESIDGGRDVNAWLRMDEDPWTSARPGDVTAWWSGRAQIALAVGEREHWHVIDQLNWNCWATGETNRLLVLEHD